MKKTILLLMLYVVACGSENTDDNAPNKINYSPQGAINQGAVVETNNNLFNTEKIDTFYKLVKRNNIPKQLKIVQVTTEGNPIYKRIDFVKENQIELMIDTHQDEFGESKKRSYTCKDMVKKSSQQKYTYFLTNCNEENKIEIISINK